MGRLLAVWAVELGLLTLIMTALLGEKTAERV